MVRVILSLADLAFFAAILPKYSPSPRVGSHHNSYVRRTFRFFLPFFLGTVLTPNNFWSIESP